jgi:hypothetical protein
MRKFNAVKHMTACQHFGPKIVCAWSTFHHLSRAGHASRITYCAQGRICGILVNGAKQDRTND